MPVHTSLLPPNHQPPQYRTSLLSHQPQTHYQHQQQQQQHNPGSSSISSSSSSTRRPISRRSSPASTLSSRLYPVCPDRIPSAPASPLAHVFYQASPFSTPHLLNTYAQMDKDACVELNGGVVRVDVLMRGGTNGGTTSQSRAGTPSQNWTKSSQIPQVQLPTHWQTRSSEADRSDTVNTNLGHHYNIPPSAPPSTPRTTNERSQQPL